MEEDTLRLSNKAGCTHPDNREKTGPSLGGAQYLGRNRHHATSDEVIETTSSHDAIVMPMLVTQGAATSHSSVSFLSYADDMITFSSRSPRVEKAAGWAGAHGCNSTCRDSYHQAGGGNIPDSYHTSMEYNVATIPRSRRRFTTKVRSTATAGKTPSSHLQPTYPLSQSYRCVHDNDIPLKVGNVGAVPAPSLGLGASDSRVGTTTVGSAHDNLIVFACSSSSSPTLSGSSSKEIFSSNARSSSCRSPSSLSSSSSSALSSLGSSASSSPSDSTESSDETDTVDSRDTPVSRESLRLRKTAEERAMELKRISRGDRKYRIYLSRQEELVQIKARTKMAHRRRMKSSQIKRRYARRATNAAAAASAAAAALVASPVQHDDQGVPDLVLAPPHTAFSDPRCDSSKSESVTENVTAPTMIKGVGVTTGSTMESYGGAQMHPTPPPQPQQEYPSLRQLRQIMLFERYHSLPGIFAMVLYCVAHVGFSEGFEELHFHVFRRYYTSYTAVTVATLAVGLGALRLSGSVWNWLSEDLYDGARFDMHNKLRLRYWDAQVMLWIRRRPAVRVSLDVCGVFLCFNSVSYLLHHVLLPLMYNIEPEYLVNHLPSLTDQSTIVTDFAEKLLGRGAKAEAKVDGFLSETHRQVWDCISNDQCCNEMIFPPDEMLKSLEEEDEDFLFDRVSPSSYYDLIGWEGMPIVSTRSLFFFHVLNALLAVVVLGKIGVGFWDE